MAREKILIVDDALLNRRLIETILKSQGYRLLTAVNGQEGLDLAIREQPDLILMDIQLPDIDGYMVTKMLKKRSETKLIPIIALTASNASEDIQRATEAGCSGYITKPFSIDSFPRIIARLLEQRVPGDT